MATLTPRLGLRKPADDGSEPVNVATDLNGNWDLVDGHAGFTRCLSTDRPADPYDGMPIKEDDTGLVAVWNADTSTWDTVTVPPDVATSATRPANPLAGDRLYETDTEAETVYTGTTWRYVGAPLVVTSADAVAITKYPGLEIYQTDTGHKMLWDGTAWRWVYFNPTPWTNLTLSSGVTAYTGFTAYSPQWRQVAPDKIELRGTLGRSSGTFSTGMVVATLPAAAQPAAQANFIGAANAVSGKGYMVRLEAQPDGEVIVRYTNLTYDDTEITWFALDGWIYDLV